MVRGEECARKLPNSEFNINEKTHVEWTLKELGKKRPK